ncbi:MAG: hypothetical protein H6831_01860 [Planctomycetes bacterium]|nr:hypothetical protein [Planctomycetota bacterium]MCB9903132.1 hypothetical protein [Planctomycetota bacterium]
MRHILLPSVAALLLSPIAVANGEGNHEWPELDRELEALNESLAVETSGPRLWGYVRTNYAFSDEERNAAGASFSGVSLDNVRLAVDGKVGNYSYRLSGDMASGTLNLLDAYTDIPIGEGITGTLGQFKAPFLSSGLVEARDLLFITRTRNGVFSSIRDAGAKFRGDHGRFHWAVAGQNGADGTADKLLLTGRASAEVVGEEMPAWEGAYSSGDEARVNLAVAYQSDDSASDAGALAVEATAIVGGIYVHGEVVDYGDDWTLDPNFPLEQRGGTTPWTLVTSWMLPSEKIELALRYEDYDDVSMPLNYDRSLFTAGANYYVEGHDLKWQLNYAYGRNGGVDDLADKNIIALGLTLGF